MVALRFGGIQGWGLPTVIPMQARSPLITASPGLEWAVSRHSLSTCCVLVIGLGIQQWARWTVPSYRLSVHCGKETAARETPSLTQENFTWQSARKQEEVVRDDGQWGWAASGAWVIWEGSPQETPSEEVPSDGKEPVTGHSGKNTPGRRNRKCRGLEWGGGRV